MVGTIDNAFKDKIECVQVCPGNLVRVTFVQVESKTFYEDIGTILFGTVVYATLKPEFVSVVSVHLFQHTMNYGRPSQMTLEAESLLCRQSYRKGNCKIRTSP